MANIESVCQSTLIILIRDIMELDIIIPRLEFSYDPGLDIQYGYYMYQNTNSGIITINIKSLLELQTDDDIMTVITYSFIHEIFHMFQNIKTDYFKDSEYHTLIEDTTDYDTIQYVKTNLDLIQKRLKFKFNLNFIYGIEAQLEYKVSGKVNFEDHEYVINVITGTLCNRLNINYDYFRSILYNNETLCMVFPDNREYYISLQGYSPISDLDLLVHLINITNFKFIYFDEVKNYPEKLIRVYLY